MPNGDLGLRRRPGEESLMPQVGPRAALASRARPERQRSQKVQPGSVDCHLLAGLEESQKLLCLGVPFLDCSKAPLLVTSYGGSKL